MVLNIIYYGFNYVILTIYTTVQFYHGFNFNFRVKFTVKKKFVVTERTDAA